MSRADERATDAVKAKGCEQGMTLYEQYRKEITDRLVVDAYNWGGGLKRRTIGAGGSGILQALAEEMGLSSPPSNDLPFFINRFSRRIHETTAARHLREQKLSDCKKALTSQANERRAALDGLTYLSDPARVGDARRALEDVLYVLDLLVQEEQDTPSPVVESCSPAEYRRTLLDQHRAWIKKLGEEELRIRHTLEADGDPDDSRFARSLIWRQLADLVRAQSEARDALRACEE
jgi:hypothetical protein